MPLVAQRQEQVIVTGTYTPIPLNEADRTVDILAIDQSPTVYRNAMDALENFPSIDVRQRAPGIQGDLTIRGSSFGQTLVLVNGLRLNDAQTGHNNLDLPFPFEAIQRIEVLEGSGSTLYGADAVGGAVNFITAPPRYSELRVGVAGGSFGTNAQNGSLVYVAGPLAEQLTFTRELSTGFIPDRDYRTLAFGSQTTYKSRFGLSDVLLGLSDRPFGAADFYGSYPSWERTKGWFAGINQQLGGNTQAAFAYRRHTDLFVLFRDQPWIYTNHHATESWQAALRRQNEITSKAHVYYGVEGYRDSIVSNNLGRHTRDRGAVYGAFDARALKRFSLNVGAREEYFTGGDTVFTPSISGGYWLTSRIKLRAAAGSAFRLPTFTDLYYSDPANVGNPYLVPERAWNYEGGLELHFARESAEFVVFHRRDRNDIDYVRANAGDVWHAENIDSLDFTGFEAMLHLEAGRAQRFDVAYAALHGVQHALNGEQSKYLFEYPVHSATLAWQGSVPGRIVTRLRIGVLDRYASNPYPLVELAAERQFPHIKPFVQLSNLTNTAYEEIPGVRMPGRSYLAGVEFSMRRGPTQ
ncbi:MAG TPA: TonB-dependent receptor [Bryobacteraceae bacterium]